MSTFEPSIDRLWERGSLRWQRRSAPDAIPLTVAELDVRTPPFVVDAVTEHLAGHGIGYLDLAVLGDRHADLAKQMFGFTDFAWSRTCSDGLQACRTALDALVPADGFLDLAAQARCAVVADEVHLPGRRAHRRRT